MKKYRGSQNSGVAAYEILEDSILLKFLDNEVYLYDSVKPGKEHVDNMKRLASEGKGLATYINQHVGNNFREKL